MVKQLHPVNFEFAYVQLFYGRNLMHNIFLLSFEVGLRRMSK